MRNSRILAVRTALSVAFTVLGIEAQTALRCDLVSKDTILSTGQTGKQCLDVASLKNQSVTIPSNVTRIDNQGLALCTRSVTAGGDADIVFIVDQSASMRLSYIYIDTTTSTRDTTYYADNTGCPAGTTPSPAIGSPPGPNIYPIAITIQTGSGPVAIWRMKNNAGCISFSGDPF